MRRGKTSSVRRSRNDELNRGMRGSLRKNLLMKMMAMTTTTMMTPRGCGSPQPGPARPTTDRHFYVVCGGFERATMQGS